MIMKKSTETKNIRKDLGTNKRFPKTDLIRVVITKNHQTFISQTKSGRGIYIHPDSLEKVLRKNILKREINRRHGDLKIIDELELLIKEQRSRKNGKETKEN